MSGGPQGVYVISSNSDRARKYRTEALQVLQHNNLTPEDVIKIISKNGLISGYHSIHGKDRIGWLFYSDGWLTSLTAWNPTYKEENWILVYKKSSLSTLAYYDCIKMYSVQEAELKESKEPQQKPSVEPVQDTSQESKESNVVH